jgi:hypothetical protein
LLGYRSDVPELMAAADVYAFPSYREGLPVSLMEAMAACKAVVCSRIRGNVDLLEDGKGGFLLQPHDVDGFAGALEKLLRDESLRRQMGQHNREVMVLGTGSLPIDRAGSGIARAAAMPGSQKHYQAKLLTGDLEFRHSSTMLRRSFLVENHLSYREDYPGLEDFRFCMEASKRGSIACLADVHLHYRVNGDGTSAGARRESPAERARLYNSIRCDSLRMSGVRLSEQDEFLLGQLLPEDALPVWNRQEREKLADLFGKIRRQLVAGGFSAIRELDEIMCCILNH